MRKHLRLMGLLPGLSGLTGKATPSGEHYLRYPDLGEGRSLG